MTGALTGMAVASALNNASRKVAVDSFIRITSRQAEIMLSHPRYSPDVVRNTLSMMFVRYQRTRTAAVPVAPPPLQSPPTSPIDELERLTPLHAAGTLTDAEFEMARVKQIRRLRDSEE